MASPSPEQQSAARQMKQVKLNKSAKPGKIDKHGASMARRSALTHRTAVQKINQLIAQIRWSTVKARAYRDGSLGEFALPENAAKKGGATPPAEPSPVTAFVYNLLKKLAALLKQLADSIFSPLAQGLSGGGGSSSSGRTYSGSDPPTNSINSFSINKTMRLPNLKEIVMGASMLAASALPMKASANPIVNPSFYQAGINSAVNFNITNPDATYDSGLFKFEDVLMPVAQAVKENNSAYVNKTVDQIMGEWGVSIQPNEVYNGWTAPLSNGNLDLTHAPFGYTEWLASNPLQDEFDFTVNFGNQLDFNNSGTYEGIERLAQLDSKVLEGFAGRSEDGYSTWSADVNQVGVVPEPMTIGLLGLGGLAALGARRLSEYGQKY